MQSHIILHVFSSNLSPHHCIFFSRFYLYLHPANHHVLFCYFSNSPFTSAIRLGFLFNHATLGLRPYPRFCLHSSHNLLFIVSFRSQLLCMAPLTSFFNDVLDSILSAVNGTDAPTLLSVSFGI